MEETEGAAHRRALEEDYARRLASTVPEVRSRIARAAAAAGRDASEVRLVAVTKGHPVGAIRAALAAGLADLGENRVEELEEKVGAIGREGVRWHMIGHLQRRKAPRALELADLIHSVDSVALAERLSRFTAGRDAAVLVQVNTSGEETKGGLGAYTSPDEAVEGVLRIAELPGLRVDGLMTMAPFDADEAELRAVFARLREVRDRARAHRPDLGAELSMGMTNDLEAAVLEGSTIVRIGTALFGERPPPPTRNVSGSRSASE